MQYFINNDIKFYVIAPNIGNKKQQSDLESIKLFCNSNNINIHTIEKGQNFSDVISNIELTYMLNKTNTLNEKCHIAAYQYLKHIQNITDWLKEQAEKDYKLNNVTELIYNIPKNLTDKITIFSSLDL